MTDLRIAAQQALDYWEQVAWGDAVMVDKMGALRAALAQQAEQAEPLEPVAWLRVIDEAMVTHHLGVADPGDDYETAKRKMNNLLCMAQDIGTYFAKQAEPVEQMPVGWLESPHGAFRADPLYKMQFPSQLLQWQIALYTAPPQRKPLKMVDLRALYDRHAAYQEEGPEASGWWDFARAVERAHGITDPQIADRLARHGIPMPGDNDGR